MNLRQIRNLTNNENILCNGRPAKIMSFKCIGGGKLGGKKYQIMAMDLLNDEIYTTIYRTESFGNGQWEIDNKLEKLQKLQKYRINIFKICEDNITIEIEGKMINNIKVAPIFEEKFKKICEEIFYEHIIVNIIYVLDQYWITSLSSIDN